jgi:hypothetical protein
MEIDALQVNSRIHYIDARRCRGFLACRIARVNYVRLSATRRD